MCVYVWRGPFRRMYVVFCWQIASLESALSQEQAMHIVTKTQLSALEDDNQRLRQQLQTARKRAASSAEPDRYGCVFI